MNQSKKYKLDLQLFAEGDPTPGDPTPGDPNPEKNYLEAIKKLKENSVSKEAYEKLEAQNKQYLEAIINGRGLEPGKTDKEEKPDIAQLRKDLFNEKSNLSNLEYCKKALELRKAIMDDGGIDPFVPVGEKIIPEDSDFKAADRVATVLQECIDASEGDSGVFTNLLQLKTIEVMPRKSTKAKA